MVRETTPRSRWPRTLAARLGIAGGVWLVALVVVRLAVTPPEHCPAVDEASARTAVAEAVGWLERNQRDDGTWLYLWDKDAGKDLGEYNLTRHAGAVMSLYQAAAAGFPGALEVADKGAAFALDRVERRGDIAVFADGAPSGAGATALLTAGLAQRRAATGDPVHDEDLLAMGRFLQGQVAANGAFWSDWDRETGPVVGTTSEYYTGEAYWAMALLKEQLPSHPFADTVRLVGNYLATARDKAEDRWPPIPDHWAAYGLAETAAWGDASTDPTRPLTPAEVAYTERLGQLAGSAVRYESQRTNGWPNWWLRGRQTLGSGLGTLGEAVTGVWHTATRDERLASIVPAAAERATCVAGMLVDRQVSPEEAALTSAPDQARGAWFQFGVTRLDDQQHAMSAILRALPLLGTAPTPPVPDPGKGMAALLGVLAVLFALNPLRFGRSVPGPTPGRRAGVAAVGSGISVAVAVGLAVASPDLLDALDVSAGMVRLAAGILLALTGAWDLFRRTPAAEPALSGWGAAVVPVTVPFTLRPALAVLALTIGLDRGTWPVALAGALGVAALAALAARPADPGTVRWRVEEWGARVVAAGAVAIAAVLVVNGVISV